MHITQMRVAFPKERKKSLHQKKVKVDFVLLCCDAADKRFGNFSRRRYDRRCRDYFLHGYHGLRPRYHPRSSSVDYKISSWPLGIGSSSRIRCLAQFPSCLDTSFRRHPSRVLNHLHCHLELEPMIQKWRPTRIGRFSPKPQNEN